MSTSDKRPLIVYFTGILYGLLYTVGGHLGVQSEDKNQLLSPAVVEGLVLTVFMPLALQLYRMATFRYVIEPLKARGIGIHFSRYEIYSYAVFAAGFGFVAGITPVLAFTYALTAILMLIQIGMLLTGRSHRVVFDLLYDLRVN
jgi:hypothetical protein